MWRPGLSGEVAFRRGCVVSWTEVLGTIGSLVGATLDDSQNKVDGIKKVDVTYRCPTTRPELCHHCTLVT